MKLDFTALFCQIDDFCQSFQPSLHQSLLKQRSRRSRKRASGFSMSEMMCIVIGFHQARFRDFKAYYLLFSSQLKAFFPSLMSDSRFVQLMLRLWLPLTAFALNAKGACTGTSFVDSTSMEVCKVKRIKRNKVFRGIAQQGKMTKGWFYGFELHLVINECGEILAFQLTPRNVDGRKPLKNLCQTMWGKLFGDKDTFPRSWPVSC